MKSYPVQENHISSSVSEILQNRQTNRWTVPEILLLAPIMEGGGGTVNSTTLFLFYTEKERVRYFLEVVFFWEG